MLVSFGGDLQTPKHTFTFTPLYSAVVAPQTPYLTIMCDVYTLTNVHLLHAHAPRGHVAVVVFVHAGGRLAVDKQPVLVLLQQHVLRLYSSNSGST